MKRKLGKLNKKKLDIPTESITTWYLSEIQ